MPKQTKDLSAIEVKRETRPGRHPVGTVPGLYLWVRESGTRNWVLRVVVKQRRSDIGLGGYPAVTLADAIQRAREIRESIARGADPLADKKAARAKLMTFQEAAEEYIKNHRPSWKNAKHAQQWENTLATYVYPSIGEKPVRDISKEDVLGIITPLWSVKNETMVRVRNRIELVLSWAMAAGHREPGLNPAAWRGQIKHTLPAPRKVNKRKHHAAMPWQDLPTFIQKLALVDGISARCLEFTILTACRSGETRGATWDEIDLKERVWNIPAERMKAGRAHRVPLSPAAIELLKQLPRIEGELLIFPGRKEATPLSDMTLTMLMRRHAPPYTVHGFRSSFRDWAAEDTRHPSEVCEMALAHSVGDETEAAYRRSDLMNKRRKLMMDWAKRVYTPDMPKGKVVAIRAA